MQITKLILTTVAAILIMTCTAFAVDTVDLRHYHGDQVWKDTYLGTPISALPGNGGLWDITGVHQTAGHKNELWLAGAASGLLNNRAIGETALDVNLDGSFFVDTSANKRYSLFGGSGEQFGGVNVYKVLKNFTSVFESKLYTFVVGDIFIALDDFSSHTDYDDFILRASAATPILGAIWLLGSGLVGLVGLRKRLS